jgi:hypothetical protein
MSLEQIVCACQGFVDVVGNGAIVGAATYGGVSLLKGLGRETTARSQLRNRNNMIAGAVAGTLFSLGVYADSYPIKSLTQFIWQAAKLGATGAAVGALVDPVMEAATSTSGIGLRQSFRENAKRGMWWGALFGAGGYALYKIGTAAYTIVK